MTREHPRLRWSLVERRILDLLRKHPTGQISLDMLAAEADADPRTLRYAMARLRCRGQVVVSEPGHGNTPHRYSLPS